MGYSVRFGEVQLENYCKVLNVSRSVMPTRTNISKTISSIHGSYYTGYRYGERLISFEVGLVGNSKTSYMEKVSKLAEVLNVSTPQELVIDDEPYKIYYAVPNGNADLSKFANTGKTTISFICNDPMAYSAYWNTYESIGRTVKMTSYGNVETYPIFDIDFKNDACFFQITNPSGATVLIGQPKDTTQPNVQPTTLVVDDSCTDSTGFGALSQTLLDTNRTVTGSYGVGLNGSAIICTNYGTDSENKWTGAAFKKQMSQELDSFEVEVDVTFSSQGKNYVEEKPIPQPTPPAPPAKPSNPTTTPSTNSLGTYKVVNCGGLWINRDANPDTPLYPMAPGTYIYPTEIKNGWAKHTHSNPWNTFTGWSSMNYLQKISSSKVTQKMTTQAGEPVYADEQVGTLEVYGYDKNGTKLFKFAIEDTSEFYEYVDPKIYIGSTQVAHDGKNTPTPRQQDSKSVASGVFGDFNDFSGKLLIRRETNSRGQQLWTCSINKIVNGKITAKIETSNSISNSKFPTGKLSYLGFYIGKYGSNEAVSSVGVNNVKVKNLNYKIDQSISGNVVTFKKGDHLQINFETGLVTINDKLALTDLDIGSEFFAIPPGYSEVAWRTDDTAAKVICGFQDKFI